MKKLLLLFIVIFIVFGITHTDHEKATPAHKWTVVDSKAYAKDVMLAWNDKQFDCLDKLWTKESHWRPEAYNNHKVMGKNAGGIPQLLGMSTNVPATRQIERGFAYILYRYGSPCQALKFHNKKGWY